jgi:hypothetical protein
MSGGQPSDVQRLSGVFSDSDDKPFPSWGSAGYKPSEASVAKRKLLSLSKDESSKILQSIRHDRPHTDVLQKALEPRATRQPSATTNANANARDANLVAVSATYTMVRFYDSAIRSFSDLIRHLTQTMLFEITFSLREIPNKAVRDQLLQIAHDLACSSTVLTLDDILEYR